MKSKKKNEKALLKLLLQQFGEITYIKIGIIVSAYSSDLLRYRQSVVRLMPSWRAAAALEK